MTATYLSADVTWLLLASILVALMQAGFTCLESGFVRLKNSINVAIKNLVDFCLANVLFALFGFGLMFGPSLGGWLGTPASVPFEYTDPEGIAFFVFQAMFCGTATTIISGAVSERMRFIGYVIVTVIIAGFIYPIVGHWIWAGLPTDTATGWLGALGFVDFAGSTAVHSVGGWVALAAILVIGPRVGRFGPQGRRIEGHNLPMAVLGVFLLWIGFFGFNGGSALGLEPIIPVLIANTTLAGAAGGLAALLASWIVWRYPLVDRIINGVLAGLVAICAPCDRVGAGDALVIGFVAGLVAVLGMRLLERLSIDDVVGAIPSHLLAGIWGTLAVALFADPAQLPLGSTGEQFLVQLMGVLVVGAFAFPVAYGLFRGLDRYLPFRVTAEQERIGLNIAEHQATHGLLDLLVQMDRQAREGDFSQPVSAEPETEAAQIATFYNAVLARFQTETERRQRAGERLAALANYDALTGLANRALFLHRLAQRLRGQDTGWLFYVDLDGFKAVNDEHGHAIGDEVLVRTSRRLNRVLRPGDWAARLGGDEFTVMLRRGTTQCEAERLATALVDALAEPIPLASGMAHIGASIGMAALPVDDGATPDQVLHAADEAMYLAKLDGKNGWRIAEPPADIP